MTDRARTGITDPGYSWVASARVSWTINTGMETRKNFQIRPARLKDVPIILQLIRDLATYERAPDEVTATEEQLADVLFGERPAAEVLLAYERETPVGFALFFHNFSTWLGRPGLYLEDLFVKPEHRGRGIGKLLLLHLTQIAKARGYGRVEWAVLDWNEPAIGFYKKVGAVMLDDWTICRVTGEALARLSSGPLSRSTGRGGKMRIDL